MARREQLDKVQDALHQGDVNAAIAELEHHLAAQPDDVDARLRLAQLFMKRGKPDDAWDWLVSAASGFIAKGFLDKAIAILHRAFELDPSRPEPALLAAGLQVKRNHAGDARKTLASARAHYHRASDRQKALLVAQKRVELVPDVDAWLDVARLFVAAGNTRQAVLILDEQSARTEVKRERRRYARARVWLHPTPRSLWRWLRS